MRPAAILLGGRNLGIDTGRYLYFSQRPVTPFES
jgi:hypothetical protein